MLKQEFTHAAIALAKQLPCGHLRVIVSYDEAPAHYYSDGKDFIPLSRREFLANDTWPILTIPNAGIMSVEVQ